MLFAGSLNSVAAPSASVTQHQIVVPFWAVTSCSWMVDNSEVTLFSGHKTAEAHAI